MKRSINRISVTNLTRVQWQLRNKTNHSSHTRKTNSTMGLKAKLYFCTLKLVSWVYCSFYLSTPREHNHYHKWKIVCILCICFEENSHICINITIVHSMHGYRYTIAIILFVQLMLKKMNEHESRTGKIILISKRVTH